MVTNNTYQHNIELRDYSSAFSRSAFYDVIKYRDFTHFDGIYSQYSDSFRTCISYVDFLKKIYSIISKEYRCEYVYKNELITHLIKQYGTKNSVAYNEFRVGNSIVDIALFNGESKAFEIKTEFDTPRRLEKQLHSYKKVFDKCYLVIPYEKVDEYLPYIDFSTGIITLKREKKHIVLYPYRGHDATQNEEFDPEILISCLRAKEYESIVQEWLGYLPPVPEYRMYKECLAVFSQIPKQRLKELFLAVIKKRQQNIDTISKTPYFLRQMCLSMNLSKNDVSMLVSKLEKQIF